jgi:preprotein translocase subunit SecE
LTIEQGAPVFRKLTDSIREFFVDVRGELKKVSFPTRAETIGSTTVVIVFCIIMSFYLSMIDSVLVWLVGKIL